MAPSNHWQHAEEMAKKHEASSSIWLKLANDRDRAVIVFLGEPYPHEVCFLDGRYVRFDDTLQKQGLRPSLRVALNVATYGTMDVKVLEQSGTFFRDLVRVRRKSSLETWAFEIQRHGAARDTKTTYSILPAHQLTAEQQREYQSLKRHDLERLYSSEGSAADALGSYGRKRDGVIDAGTAQAITEQLKAMPPVVVDCLCSEFGVAQLSDLPAAQIEKIRALVELVVSKYGPPTAADTSETEPSVVASREDARGTR